MSSEAITELVEVMRKLRAPGGCPWDREQTHRSLMPFLLEERGELLDAIDAGDDENFKEELGDVLMHLVFHSVMAEERGMFSFDDVAKSIVAKMKFRHPHVFSDVSAPTSNDVIDLWEKVKAKEPGHAPGKKTSVLDGVPNHCPALIQAEKVQKKAAKVGFDWSTQEQILDKIEEEIGELRSAMKTGDNEQIDGELGDLLFAVANLSRFRKRDSAELLLARATKKFKNRFAFIEKKLAEQHRAPEKCTLEELDALWNEAKKQESDKK